MQLGFVGLGRMGGNMVHRLARGGHEVVVFNRSPGPVQEAVKHGCIGATSSLDRLSAEGAVEDHLSQRALEFGEFLVVQLRHEQLGDHA